MAKGAINDFLYWLAHSRSTTDYTKFFTPNTSNVTMVNGQFVERCGIVSYAIQFKLKSSLTIPASGDCDNVVVGTALFPPNQTMGFTSRGNATQIFGTISSDGTVTITGAGSHGSSYTVGTSSALYITATYVTGGVE